MWRLGMYIGLAFVGMILAIVMAIIYVVPWVLVVAAGIYYVWDKIKRVCRGEPWITGD